MLAESNWIRSSRWPLWHGDRQPVHLLQPVRQHWAVCFMEKSSVDPNLVIRPDAEKIPVICSVMDLAQRHSIWYYRIPPFSASPTMWAASRSSMCRSWHTAQADAYACRTCSRKMGWCRRWRVKRAA